MAPKPLGKGTFGAEAAATGVVTSPDGGSVLLTCGGWDRNDVVSITRECFTLGLSDKPKSGTMLISRAAPLPKSLAYTCHGSDGERMVVAGGSDGTQFPAEVLELPAVE